MSPVDLTGKAMVESADAGTAASIAELKRTATVVAVVRVRLRTLFRTPRYEKNGEAAQ
jgi:hypothetical protein